MNLPSYSVIVPTHRRPQLLNRALSSLKRQNFGSQLEIIVVSDCMDRHTDEICYKWLESSDVYIRRSGSFGPSESRNLGLRIAKGKVVLFLDDDDAWHDGLLKSLDGCHILKSGSPVYFNCTVVKERRLPDGPLFLEELNVNSDGFLNENVYVKNQIHMSCFAFPAHLLRGIEFDVNMRAYEDWDFLLTVFDREIPQFWNVVGSKVHEVDDLTTDRRGNSIHANDLNAILDYIYVYRRHPVAEKLKIKRAALLAQAGFSIVHEVV